MLFQRVTAVVERSRCGALTFDFTARRQRRRSSLTYDAERRLRFRSSSAPRDSRCAVPEGNYRVTLKFSGFAQTHPRARAGRAAAAHDRGRRRRQGTRAQLHRECAHRRSGARCPRMPPVARESRSSRARIGSATWDDKLTLEIRGRCHAAARCASQPVDLPTLVPRGRFDGHGSGRRSRGRAGARCCRDSSAADIAVAEPRRVRRDAEVLRHRAASRQTAVDAQSAATG